MAFPALFRKKFSTALAKPEKPSLKQSIDRVHQITGDQIRNGLAMPNAGTGKPIRELKGAAKTNAQLANIGGGSKANGGGGMAAGVDRIFRHGQADGAKTILENSNTSNTKRLKK